MSDVLSATGSSGAIRALNDAFRTTLQGGHVLMTAGVQQLPDAGRDAAIEAMRSFSDFTRDNDPHGEHDFGNFSIFGQRFFWKIDYYDENLEFGSSNPADATVTTRVLTLMLAEEY